MIPQAIAEGMLGIIFIVSMAIGMITPLVGSCLYVAANITGISFERVSKAAFPYVLMEVVATIKVTCVAPVSLCFSGLMKNQCWARPPVAGSIGGSLCSLTLLTCPAWSDTCYCPFTQQVYNDGRATWVQAGNTAKCL